MQNFRTLQQPNLEENNVFKNAVETIRKRKGQMGEITKNNGYYIAACNADMQGTNLIRNKLIF